MSAGVRCPHCNLVQSLRSDGLCPRCRRDVTVTSVSMAVSMAPSSAPPEPRSRGIIYLLVAVALVAAIGFGYHYYRYRAAVDYSTRAGLLEPVRAGDWVESVDASAQVQIATEGWFRHTNREAGRIFLSCPEFDTHVVLLVETTGRGRRTPPAAEIARRAVARLEQKVEALEISMNEKIPTEEGNAHRVDVDVLLERTRLAYRYRLASKPGHVTTLVCFGPPDTIGHCPMVLESFAWSS